MWLVRSCRAAEWPKMSVFKCASFDDGRRLIYSRKSCVKRGAQGRAVLDGDFFGSIRTQLLWNSKSSSSNDGYMSRPNTSDTINDNVADWRIRARANVLSIPILMQSSDKHGPFPWRKKKHLKNTQNFYVKWPKHFKSSQMGKSRTGKVTRGNSLDRSLIALLKSPVWTNWFLKSCYLK